MFLNIQSIANKTQEMDVVLQECNLDLVCLSEHWLKPQETQFYNLNGYSLAACYARESASHGGSSIYVRKDSEYKLIDIGQFCMDFHHESVAINLLNGSKNVIVVSVYRSPNGDPKIFLSKFEDMLEFFQRFKCPLVIGGDFNIDLVSNYTKTCQWDFARLLRQYNLHFTNSSPTRNNAVLDNVLTDLTHGTYSVSVHQFGLSDHAAILFDKLKPESTTSVQNPSPTSFRPITEKRIEDYAYYLSCVDWSCLDQNCNAEDSFKMFFETMKTGYENSFPLTTRKCNSAQQQNKLPWYNDDLREKRRILLILHDRHKIIKTDESQKALSRYRSLYRKSLRQAKKQYIADNIEKSDNKCKTAWNFIRKEKSAVSQPQISIDPNQFNDFFVSSVKEAAEETGGETAAAVELLNNIPITAPSFQWKTVTCEEVLSHVKCLKSSKSQDIYGLSSFLLKAIVSFVLVPLTFCFNKCITEGVFPSKLKLSKVVPIFKKGNRDLPSSYRPVSLVPVLGKVLERIMHSQLYQHFEQNSIFSTSQYGFRTGKSTIQAVSKLVDNIISNFESKLDTGVTLCDLSKAFDCVDHNTLISKLSFYGVRGTALSLVESYLDERKQIVSVNGQLSDCTHVRWGVPQGSVIGPLLFVIMMNDINSNVPCDVICFADDTTLCNSDINLDSLVYDCNNSFDQASVWFKANGFLLNKDKTQSIIFSQKKIGPLDPHPTDTLDEVKLLGVVLDRKLTWRGQTNYMCNKLSRVVYLLRALSTNVPKAYLKVAYHSFFQSILLYGICLWGSSSGVSDMLLIQKNAVRILAGAKLRDHCRPLFVQESVLTVYCLFVLNVLVEIKKSVSSLNLRSDVHMHNTRNQNKIDVPYCRLSRAANNYKVLGIKMFNKLPVELRDTIRLSSFKSIMTEYLLKHPLYSIQEFFDCDFTVMLDDTNL